MKGYLFVEVDGEELVCKCNMQCSKLDTWLILDECRKALNISNHELTGVAAMLALMEDKDSAQAEKNE